ncbi:MAG: hypothetical protein IJZ74_04630 [Clostridia bacterium]|nr:hypothetical protein [Clostridia bacterium]
MHDFVILISLDDTACRTMARRLRAEHIYCRIMPQSVTADEILQQGALGILLAAKSTGEPAEVPHMMDYLQSGLPMLCMGDAALTLCQTLGGTLAEQQQESGVVQVQFERGDKLFDQVEDGERFLPACRYLNLADGQGTPAAMTDAGLLGFRATQRDVWGLAFPLERNDPGGTQLLINFCKDICGCTLWWSNHAFVERAKEEIARAAGDGDALCALSGGVDSGVCALLGNMALGRRLHCIFVDTGLLRKGEASQVMDFYHMQVGLNLRRIDASEEFLAALDGVTLPQEKEQIITRLLREVLNREAAAIPNVQLMIQGTNYSDVQDSSDFPLEAPSEDVRIVEPVRELFKDEIRYVGEELGLSPAMIQRQPFPGSGLASRIMGCVTREKLAILREADDIFRYEIVQSNQNKRLWQYFAALAESPMPDGGLIVTLRAVQAVDGAAAMAARLPSDLLERVTTEIMNRCPQVRRVMYDLTPSKRYGQVEWR